jgi:hypothetical protein
MDYGYMAFHQALFARRVNLRVRGKKCKKNRCHRGKSPAQNKTVCFACYFRLIPSDVLVTSAITTSAALSCACFPSFGRINSSCLPALYRNPLLLKDDSF